MKIYDLIIIGGGPAGYRAAEYAGENGMSVLLAEKRALGGVCLNEGCIPTKTLLHSAKLFDYAKGGGEKYGVTAENARLDHAAVVDRKNRVVRQLVSGVAAKMKAAGVTVIAAEAEISGRSGEGFKILAGGEAYTGKRLLLATGSEAVVPGIPGLAESIASGFAVTNRELLDEKGLPSSLCVIGGGVIGLEMASYFASAGAKVTVVEMLDRVGGMTDRDVSAILKSNMEKKGVAFELGAKVVSVSPGAVEFERNGEQHTVHAEKCLISIGRRAVTPKGLEALGIVTGRGAVTTDEQMKTSAPGVFAAGDVNGKSMLAHTAYREAEVAVNTMLGRRDRMDYSAVPSVIYTNPEAASVGETEETAREKGLDITVTKLPMNYSGRYLAENEGGDGICKLVFEKGTDRLLGVCMLANPASEIIYGAAALIGLQARAKDIQKVIFPHPTVAEVIREGIFR